MFIHKVRDTKIYKQSTFTQRCKKTNINKQKEGKKTRGSGCSSVGRAVASNTRGPLFEYNNWQNLNMY